MSSDDTTLAAGLDRSGVDDSQRLQDDLFGHVNGAWLRDHVMPADRSSDGEFRRLRDLSESQVREIVEDAASAEVPADPSTPTERIGALYRLFMDTEAIEGAGRAPLEPLLDEIVALSDHTALTRAMASPDAGTSLIHAYVWTDDRDSTRYQVKLHQGGLGLPDESYYREDRYAEIREAYVTHLGRLAQLAALPGRDGLVDGDATAQARAVMDLETRLAGTHVDVVRLRDSEKSDNPMGRAELREAAPGLDWNAYIEGTGAAASAFEVVNVGQPEFLAGAAPLFADEPLPVLRTWLALHTVSAYAPYLSSDFVEAEFDFSGRVLSGAEELRERWKRGVAFVEGAVGFDVGREYVERHFPASHKERMQGLVDSLLAAYRTSISSLDWMTPATRDKALEKLERFTPKIGYPEQWRSYDGLVVDPADLVASVRASRRFDAAYEFGKVGGPIDPYEWHMTPQTVNAYYNPGANEIVFPAAILQPPFFDADAEDAVNFGGIGAVIGHEIGHGFDDQGSKYDGDGNLRSWWTEEDRREFEKRTAALIEQYSALSPRELDDTHHVSGALTIGENIGDLGGLSIAVAAYLSHFEGEEPPVLDGMTGLQRLFWSWATVWRGKNRPQESIRRLATDPHSPAEFRCNVPAAHIDAFYEAFDVTEGDAMYLAPERRVRIW
ncbi:peptidase M13 [Brachybacterium huguangmaarense]|uniref:Peptidase M13 n=1 Tax=Brachybacterium huguangmaarense TaxID=1652028 RepID=A0ABY6G286_9MICO|nr:M13-type metalloendopeptidase [Brachybacterium huguangmaarense]UYG16756.1 peptidase M13 [Brachybacterium huguangmaarense]